MNEQNSIRLSLLKIGGCDKKPNIESNHEENRRWDGEEGNHLACQWVEVRRRCVLVPIDSVFAHEISAIIDGSRVGMRRSNNSYSTDIRKAALVAHGANTNETISVAPNNNSQACGLEPLILAWTAPLPKMSTGM